MKSGFMDDLQITEGRIRGLVVTDDSVEFIVAQARAQLRKSAVTMALRNGDHVHLVLGDSLFGQHAILAVHRNDDGITQYVGPSIGPKCILVSAMAFAFAMWLQSPWLLLLATAPIVALHTVFVRDRKRVLSHLKTHAQRLAIASTGDIPLTLPARGTDWPTQILDFTNDAIIIWEMEGAGIVYWNRAAERIYGYTREEACGKVTHELLKTEIEGGTDELEARLERFGVWIGTLRHTRSDGQILEVEGRLSLMAQEHRPWLVLEVNRDVTDRRRAEAERAEAVRQLRRLRSLAPVRPPPDP
jgi:PAS domain S-box-containing protein